VELAHVTAAAVGGRAVLLLIAGERRRAVTDHGVSARWHIDGVHTVVLYLDFLGHVVRPTRGVSPAEWASQDVSAGLEVLPGRGVIAGRCGDDRAAQEQRGPLACELGE